MDENLKNLLAAWLISRDWADFQAFVRVFNRQSYGPGCHLCKEPTWTHRFTTGGIRVCKSCGQWIWRNIDLSTLDQDGRIRHSYFFPSPTKEELQGKPLKEPYLRNPESDLRKLENDLAINPSLENLYLLNSARKNRNLKPIFAGNYNNSFEIEMLEFLRQNAELKQTYPSPGGSAFDEDGIPYSPISKSYMYAYQNRLVNIVWFHPEPSEIVITIWDSKVKNYTNITFNIREASTNPKYTFYLSRSSTRGREDLGTIEPLEPWLYDPKLMLDFLIKEFDEFNSRILAKSTRLRRNPESDLRQAEEQYQLEPTLANLQQLNIVRNKRNLPLLFENDYHSMLISDIESYLRKLAIAGETVVQKSGNVEPSYTAIVVVLKNVYLDRPEDSHL